LLNEKASRGGAGKKKIPVDKEKGVGRAASNTRHVVGSTAFVSFPRCWWHVPEQAKDSLMLPVPGRSSLSICPAAPFRRVAPLSSPHPLQKDNKADSCDGVRPCSRCLGLGIPHMCIGLDINRPSGPSHPQPDGFAPLPTAPDASAAAPASASAVASPSPGGSSCPHLSSHEAQDEPPTPVPGNEARSPKPQTPPLPLSLSCRSRASRTI